MGGFVYHVLNRGARRGRLLDTAADYDAFVRILREALALRPIRLLNFCAMPNHFHLVLWPETDQQMPAFMHWFTATHGIRWRIASNTVGEGAVYQGRYKAIPVQTDNHFLTVARYVERNPVRAHLVAHAEEWRWSSLWHRDVAKDDFPLATWPIAKPPDWLLSMRVAQSRGEVAAIRRSVNRGCPLGNPGWQDQMAEFFAIPKASTVRGRPKGNAR